MIVKIKWVPLSIEDFYYDDTGKYSKIGTFWIIKGHTNCVTGYFDNFDELNDEEADHFLTYRHCYYLKGKPCEREDGMCSCLHEEEDGKCVVDSISNSKTLEHMVFARLELFQKIKGSSSMNGINFG